MRRRRGGEKGEGPRGLCVAPRSPQRGRRETTLPANLGRARALLRLYAPAVATEPKSGTGRAPTILPRDAMLAFCLWSSRGSTCVELFLETRGLTPMRR